MLKLLAARSFDGVKDVTTLKAVESVGIVSSQDNTTIVVGSLCEYKELGSQHNPIFQTIFQNRCFRWQKFRHQMVA